MRVSRNTPLATTVTAVKVKIVESVEPPSPPPNTPRAPSPVSVEPESSDPIKSCQSSPDSIIEPPDVETTEMARAKTDAMTDAATLLESIAEEPSPNKDPLRLSSKAANLLRYSFTRLAELWTLPDSLSFKIGKLAPQDALAHPVLCGPLDANALSIVMETHNELAVPVAHITSCNEYKVTDACMSDTLEFMIAIVEKEQPFCILGDYRNLRPTISQTQISDILRFMRTYKQAVDRLNTCSALITSSWIMKGIINVILRAVPPAQPTQIFSTEEEAHAFLKKCVGRYPWEYEALNAEKVA